MRCIAVPMFAVCVLASTLMAADAASEAIKPLADITPKDEIYKASSASKPLVVKSEKDAEGYFEKDELAKLTKNVDFTKQIVLVFAWQGSGGDKLDYTVAESYPEQIRFSLKRGLTKDLRSHVKIYVLRSNVQWSAK